MQLNLIEYSDVLADLESRRQVLHSRVINIDSAIDAIGTLISDGSARKAVTQASSENIRTTGAAGHGADMERRRKKAALNVYVNQFPEWSRTMAATKTVERKQNGIRCPKCGSPDTRQSVSRGISDFFMFLFDYTNARCRNCNSRFRVWRPKPGVTFKAQVPETEKFVS